MFGFNFLRGVHGKDQNLPRVRVTTLKERQMDSCLISVNTVEVFFIESHHKIENSNIVLMGMRSQLLYRDGERALAVMLNMIRANYGHAGMSSHIDVFLPTNLGPRLKETKVLSGALRSFVKRYKGERGMFAVRQPTYSIHDAHFRLDCLLAMLIRLKSSFQQRQLNFSDLDLHMFEKHIKYVVRYAISEMCCYYKALCGVSEATYPGPIRLRAFLDAYSNHEDYAIRCVIPNGPLDGPLVVGDESTILVNYKGLAVVSYRSTVTYESQLFGSPFRGYLLLFQYTMFDGPLNVPVPLFTTPRLYEYTSEHMASVRYDPEDDEHVKPVGLKSLVLPEPFVSDANKRQLPSFVWVEVCN